MSTLTSSKLDKMHKYTYLYRKMKSETRGICVVCGGIQKNEENV